MLPDEDPEELVLMVHFYGVRSSGGLCMAAVKRMIDIARQRGRSKKHKYLKIIVERPRNLTFGQVKQDETKNSKIGAYSALKDQNKMRDLRKISK